jgi:hypothetical protein
MVNINRNLMAPEHNEANNPFIEHLRRTIQQERKFPRKPKKLDQPPPLYHGWLLPYLLEIDLHTWRRWEYWARCMEAGRLIDAPLPHIPWLSTTQRHNPALKMLEACLNTIPRHGAWQTWGSWSYFEYFLDWLLYGFGHPGQPELPVEPAGCEGASERLYQVFCLEALLAWPYDYFGDILADNRHGRGMGFYPTPLEVVTLMVEMLFCDTEKDSRTETVCDPAVGTGRMLLVASSFSVRLFGQDVNPTVLKGLLVNGYAYAPWLVRPFPFLDAELLDPARSAALSAEMTEIGLKRADVADYLAKTEHDAEEQWRFEPLKKRRYPAGSTFEDRYRKNSDPATLQPVEASMI